MRKLKILACIFLAFSCTSVKAELILKREKLFEDKKKYDLAKFKFEQGYCV